MKFHFLSVLPILLSRIAFGAPNGVSLFDERETNVMPELFLRRDITKPLSRDFWCGDGRRQWCYIQLNLCSPYRQTRAS